MGRDDDGGDDVNGDDEDGKDALFAHSTDELVTLALLSGEDCGMGRDDDGGDDGDDDDDENDDEDDKDASFAHSAKNNSASGLESTPWYTMGLGKWRT